MNKLSEAAQKILDDRAEAWEYLLFAQVLEDELALARRRVDLVAASVPGSAPIEEPSELGSWCMGKLDEFMALLHRLPLLVKRLEQQAFGPPGKPGDPETIHLLAQEIALLFREALQWHRNVAGTPVIRRFTDVREAIARLGTDAIQPVETYPKLIRDRIAQVLREPPPPGTVVQLSLELAEPDTESVLAALSEALGVPREELEADGTEVSAFEAWFQDEQGW